MEPSIKPEATKEETKVTLKETCSECEKPLTKGTSGNISAWLFKGMYCTCAVSTNDGQNTAHLSNKSTDDSVNDFDNDYDRAVALREGSTTKKLLPAGVIARTRPETLVGSIIDSYVIIEFVGQGLSGHVYKVMREGLDGVFALKIITPTLSFTKRHNQRFLNEAENAKELDHPNVITTYDAGVTDDQVPYIVTDFFEGERLSDILSTEGNLQESVAIDLFIQICDGLIHAHYLGILHRDLKPSNIRINGDISENHKLKIADCGVSKVLPDPSRETRYFTEHGYEYGDATYMSPEQCRGVKIDQRSDIYSLGCLMYQCLSGLPPFSAKQNTMLMYKHVSKRPRSLHTRFPEIGLTRTLEDLIMRCLEKDPEDRYQSISDLREDLETIKARKPVRRAFRKKLSYKEREETKIIPDTVSAAVSAIWFGLSTTLRLYVIALAISVVISIALILAFGQYNSASKTVVTNIDQEPAVRSEPIDAIPAGSTFESRLATIRDDAQNLKDFALSKDIVMFGQVDAFLKDLDTVTSQRNLAEPKWSPSEEVVVINRLDKRLSDMTLQLNPASNSYSKKNTILKLDGTVLFTAPEGTTPARTLLLAILQNIDLRGANLRRFDLSGLTISGAKLQDADLASADLRGTTIEHSDLKGANFDYANMRHARLVDDVGLSTSFVGTNLDGSTITSTGLRGSSFRFASLSNAEFIESQVREAEIRRCTMNNLLVLDSPQGESLDSAISGNDLTKTKAKIEGALERTESLGRSLTGLMAVELSSRTIQLPGSMANIELKDINPGLASPLTATVDRAMEQLNAALEMVRSERRLEIMDLLQRSNLENGTLPEKRADRARIKKQLDAIDATLKQVDKEVLTLKAQSDEANKKDN
ncbi:MAG: protein kinase [Candidatus Obscuribacterales bacterium]|nr:protein kinase [Candidatus Obscuribacterales bacterium]